MANGVDPSIATKANEIRTLPYARSIVSEDVIERNFGFKIIREQVSIGRNSMIYKSESAKYPNIYCVVKAYKLGKDKVKASFKEETCQIMRFVSGKCPQIVSIVDVFYTSEKIYLMCDWAAKGEVLENLRQKTIRLNEEMLRNWTNDILSAISFLHSNAICHRNVAPSCLLLTGDNRVKIGTLGDACIYCTPDGALIKQKWPKFSRVVNWNQPPEVAKGKSYDPRRADVWSIGATIYWFIAKTYPIDYKSDSKMTKNLEHRLGYMRKVSHRCQNFVKKMLTYQPSGRPTIAQAREAEWFSMSVSAGGAAAAKEITAPVKVQEPGEAAGPDETAAQTEAEASASNREAAQKALEQLTNNQAVEDNSNQPPE